jgi:2-polyprenyl-6-methoxyphenol hydroxylase-like FAD-dependent oxidoreductase
MPSAARTDVLVVGAGPTGLLLASELHRHGVACRIVDRADGPTDEARACGIQSRTLEILDAVGIVEPFLRGGVACSETNVYAPPLTRLKTVDDSTLDTPYPFALNHEQSKTERLLERRLKDLGDLLQIRSWLRWWWALVGNAQRCPQGRIV